MKSSASTLRLPLSSLLAAWAVGIFSAVGQVSLSGELKKWHNVTLICTGPQTSEADSLNPFTDYRLSVTFTNGATTYVVPGYYAADGNAAESSADSGDKWLAHFTPDAVGEWSYFVSFRTAPYIAVSNDSGISVPPLDSASGSFFVQQSNKSGNDFRAKGMLRSVGAHHLQFAETEEYFLKGGTNSPENFLAYYEFDQTSDLGGINDNTLVNGLHQYAPHVQHWQQGDPTWQSGKGKGIIGALNYLAAQNVNSVYFMPYTIDGGDGRDTWMWTSPTERERFDCSKLAQWEIVFSHMDSLGIQLHLVTQEQENDQSLGDSLQQLNNIRKLYYRVQRGSNSLPLVWRLKDRQHA